MPERSQPINPMKNFARIRKRIYGGLIDYVVFMTVMITYTFIFGHPNEEGGYSVNGIAALPIYFFWFIYFAAAEGVTDKRWEKNYWESTSSNKMVAR
jgi:uncharacterized RDD family membrane protein YckC